MISLPNTLRVMLGQLLCNNKLAGWNVYENKYKQICCNIRFDVEQSGHIVADSAVRCDLACSFRRVSAQQQRDET